MREEKYLCLKKVKNYVKLHAFPYINCKECRKKAVWEFEFIKDPWILFIESANSSTVVKGAGIPPVNHSSKFRMLI